MASYFYLQEGVKNNINADFLDQVERYAELQKMLIYVIDRPLIDQKYSYSYTDALILLAPKHKVVVMNYSNEKVNDFENYIDDLIEDVGSISDKYLYKDVIGRTRQWRSTLVYTEKLTDDINVESLFHSTKLNDETEIKKLDLLISLFTGSINDIDRVKKEIPVQLLDKVKQKIQLFDADQTKFVYQRPNKKRISIQGLSGTGKTELLLHKLKDLYVGESSSTIYFTCHNRILADNLHKRIPTFFNFLKVEQQIEWGKRLWCTNAWGSKSYPNSGAYSYICNFYGIQFYPYSGEMTFAKVCRLAVESIKNKYVEHAIPPAFTYMLVDESQDFTNDFFELCELVTEKNVYVAGDIFQNIFDSNISGTIQPDYLLGKCYRTDPKTLMFAHGLGMGLFEANKLRWLEKKEWQDCGYNVKIDNNQYFLSREPLRRFEDISDDFKSIQVVEWTSHFSDKVISLIKQIKEENPTLLPDDIGIIFIDYGSSLYKLADILEIEIQKEIGWAVNKAYETKEKRPNSILISNRNNVKGLEFPFAICITERIRNGLAYRNSLYTMLTRSFLKSFFLIPSKVSSGFTSEMDAALLEINTNNRMVIDEPSDEEKQQIQTRFEYIKRTLSHYDLMMHVFNKLTIDKSYHNILQQLARQADLIESDEETLTDFVRDNIKYLKDTTFNFENSR